MTNVFTPRRRFDDAALSPLPLFKDVLYDLLIPNSIQPVSVQRCPNFILALFRI